MHKNAHKLKETAKKAWQFIWESDSVWSWLLNIVIAFLLIKFAVYPGLGMIFHTSFPLVAVVSGSMEHKIVPSDINNKPYICDRNYEEKDFFLNLDEYWNNCGKYYERINITKERFSGFFFKNGFDKGDIIFIYGTDPKNLKIGDVIVFQKATSSEPIIHRIVDIKEVGGKRSFVTKGDHNEFSGPIDKNISEDIILGKGVFRIPYLGWVKIWFVDLINWLVPIIASFIIKIKSIF
jgi:signal peptidase I